MRRHYESLNYLDGQPNDAVCRFSRTSGDDRGVFVLLTAYNSDARSGAAETALTRGQARNLRDMLNEVLEDWQ